MRLLLTTMDGQQVHLDTVPRRATSCEQPIPCLRCGRCCIARRPVLEEEDIARIATNLGLTRAAFAARYLAPHPSRPGGHLFRKRTGPCPFLEERDGETSCAIYAFKPAACQDWQAALSKEEGRAGLLNRYGATGLVSVAALYPSASERQALVMAVQGSTAAQPGARPSPTNAVNPFPLPLGEGQGEGVPSA